MFGYTPAQIAIGLLVVAIVGVLAWYQLSFRWSVWKGRKIAQQQQADEAEKLKREMDEIRPEFPNASDRELEKIVRGRRMQRIIAAMEERNGMHLSTKRTQMGSVGQRADQPITAHAVRNEPPKFNDTHRSPLEDVALAVILNQQHQYDEVEMGRPDDPVVEKFDARHHNVPSAGPEYHWPASKETPQENEVKGKGNDTTTGNVGSTRSSGHRADRDDSSGAQEGWGSERLQGGSGWGGGSFGSSSRDDSRDDSRDYGGSDSSSSSSSSD